jgi:hypothetical protein
MKLQVQRGERKDKELGVTCPLDLLMSDATHSKIKTLCREFSTPVLYSGGDGVPGSKLGIGTDYTS